MLRKITKKKKESKYRHTDHTDNSGEEIKPYKYDDSTPWMDCFVPF